MSNGQKVKDETPRTEYQREGGPSTIQGFGKYIKAGLLVESTSKRQT